MGKGIIRLLAFFNKEISEVRRQPRLVLSLLLGPFLILLLFGIGYQGDRPVIRTALVVPQDRLDDPILEQIKRSVAANFDLRRVDSDMEGAMEQLRRYELDVVEVLPDDFEERALRGEQSAVQFKYNEINPLNEQWIQYLGYAQVNELNKAILTESTRSLQGSATQTQATIVAMRKQLDDLGSAVNNANSPQTQQTVRQIRDAAGALAASPLLAGQVLSGTSGQTAQEQLLAARDTFDQLDKTLQSGTPGSQEIATAREQLVTLEQIVGQVANLSPEVIVTPLVQENENLRGKSYDFMVYYAPGVLALILQHIGVTLGSLSLVREKLLGATEFYGVAPVSMIQVLVGKYLGYTLFVCLIAAVLIGLMVFPGFTLPGVGDVALLGIPFNGDIGVFVGVFVLFVLASLGIGFLVSAISSTDSQAVQLSMLVLLMSIFFSGFFLPLDNFSDYIRPVGLILPMTHGITSFQDIMLRGIAPGPIIWIGLSAIAIVSFVLVCVFWRRQFRRVG